MASATRDDAPKSVLGRAFAILDAFDVETSELTLAELSAVTGIPKPTVHRIAAELIEWRMLERTPDGYRLGLRVFELGSLVRRQRQGRGGEFPYVD